MAHAPHLNFDSTPGLSPAGPTLPASESELREILKHCSPATREAARLYGKTGRSEYVPAIVHGVIARFVDPERLGLLREPGDDLRLQEDLGLDSLALMEIVIRLEDVLQISVRDDELRHFRTLGEVRELIARTLAASNSARSTRDAKPR